VGLRAARPLVAQDTKQDFRIVGRSGAAARPTFLQFRGEFRGEVEAPNAAGDRALVPLGHFRLAAFWASIMQTLYSRTHRRHPCFAPALLSRGGGKGDVPKPELTDVVFAVPGAVQSRREVERRQDLSGAWTGRAGELRGYRARARRSVFVAADPRTAH